MITVKGVEVRPEEINLEVDFQDLTAEGQKRIFLENKEEFIEDALNSKYSTVRRLLWEPEVLETCSSALLNNAIILCCLDKKEVDDIMTLINTLGSEVDEGCIEFIACAGFVDVKLKVLVAQNEKTSLRILKVEQMFKLAARELIQSSDPTLFDAIVLNSNFEWDSEIEEKIEKFSPVGREIIRARIEKLKR